MMTKPVFLIKDSLFKQIEAGVKNLIKFLSKTTFEVYVNGRYVRKYNGRR